MKGINESCTLGPQLSGFRSIGGLFSALVVGFACKGKEEEKQKKVGSGISMEGMNVACWGPISLAAAALDVVLPTLVQLACRKERKRRIKRTGGGTPRTLPCKACAINDRQR